MRVTGGLVEATPRTITAGELGRRLDDPSVVVIDARPAAAFNGWRTPGARRGGHVPGARSFPAAWLADARGVELLGQLRWALDDAIRETVVVADRPADAAALANALGHEAGLEVRILEGGWAAWAEDEASPVERLANHQALVHPAWLRGLIDGARVEAPPAGLWRLFHVSFADLEGYARSHLPRAVHLDTSVLEHPSSGDIRPPAELEAALRSLGIAAATTVVLYGRDSEAAADDDGPAARHAGQLAAARAAFILQYAGLPDVRLLDGGYGAWLREDGEVVAGVEAPTPVASTGLRIPERPDLVIDADEARRMAADRDGAALVSIRSWAEQSGETSGYATIDRGGRIDGDVWGDCGSDAYHMEAYRSIDDRMRPYPEIAARWAAAGITPEKRIAFYCGTGWRASEAWFDAHLLGWSRIALYDGGWAEWSRMDTTDTRAPKRTPSEHWDRVYTRTPLERTGWYESDPSVSLELIERCGLAPDDPIIDVGAGASLLIDRLIEGGHRDLIASDISEVALGLLRERLGSAADGRVRFLADDLAHPRLLRDLRGIALWHDRAALHFLTEPADRGAYAETLRRSVRPGGFVVLAAFAPDGATHCSGLPVRRYDADALGDIVGPGFERLESRRHVFTNPSGDPRPYVYALFRAADHAEDRDARREPTNVNGTRPRTL